MFIPSCLLVALIARDSEDAPAAVPAPLAQITGIRAADLANVTRLDIQIAGGVTKPKIVGRGFRVDLLLPNASIAPGLPRRTLSGGLVSGISVSKSKPPRKWVRIVLAMKAPASARLLTGWSGKTLRLAVEPIGREAPSSASNSHVAGRYDVHAYQGDVAALLLSLGQEAGVNVMMAGTVDKKVTVDIRQAPIEKAFDLLTKAAGLICRRDGETYVVGTAKDIEAAYPSPRLEPVKPLQPEFRQEIYHCVQISALDLVAALEKTYDKDKLRVAAGAGAVSPRLADPGNGRGAGGAGGTGQSGGQQTSASSSGGGGQQSVSDRLVTREVILSGDAQTVGEALALARKLDVRRKQVKIGVTISDISTDALKQLGIQWNWSNYSVQEVSTHGINFGTFAHTPVSINATIDALQTDGRAKLLAAPTLTLLDGEQSYLLIGDRLKFPKLTGYTQASTPIYDTEEERVGIYLQVSAQVGENGEITLTIYPQVSVVTGYLNVGGASYPQISTREQQTTIRVKDGQQIVVGGLIRNEELQNIQKVPILSKIPLFGELFTWRKTTRNHTELIVTITPEILKDAPAAGH